ncbi:MAG: ATP-binding protein [Jatrophihabitans sp.]|uniref:GAF domain-containing sensor histidine kinase n=1 Tax=Jatrophihabitans sp. TaxID=1932789 RepID=UPI00391082B5
MASGQSGTDQALAHVETLDHLLDERADIVALLDRTSLLRETSHCIRQNTGLDLGYAAALECPDLLVIRGWAGATGAALRNLEVPRGCGLGGKSFALARPVWVPDYCSAANITHEFDAVIRSEGIGAMMAVPLVHREQIVGVAYAAQRGPASLGDVVIRQLERVTEPVGSALHLARQAGEQTTAALAAERQRIAIALHDSVGALLFGIGAEVRDLQADTDVPPQLVAKLRAVEARVAETAAVFRQSLAVLDEVTPDQSLAATLRGDCEAFTRRTGVVARCVALTDLPALDPSRCSTVVAVVREALVNVEKHAHATSVVVSLVTAGDGLAVAVADDGLGWPDAAVAGAESASELGARHTGSAASSSGMGVKASYDRVARIGGALSIVGNEDGGLTVRAWVPSP